MKIDNCSFYYSKDLGATFSSVISLNCTDIQIDLLREEDTDRSNEVIVDNEKQNIPIVRVKVTIKFDTKQFNSDHTANYNTNFLNVNYLRCSVLIKLITGSDINGFTYFTASNTNYLTVLDAPDIIYNEVNPNKIREVTLILITCKSITLP